MTNDCVDVLGKEARKRLVAARTHVAQMSLSRRRANAWQLPVRVFFSILNHKGHVNTNISTNYQQNEQFCCRIGQIRLRSGCASCAAFAMSVLPPQTTARMWHAATDHGDVMFAKRMRRQLCRCIDALTIFCDP